MATLLPLGTIQRSDPLDRREQAPNFAESIGAASLQVSFGRSSSERALLTRVLLQLEARLNGNGVKAFELGELVTLADFAASLQRHESHTLNAAGRKIVELIQLPAEEAVLRSFKTQESARRVDAAAAEKISRLYETIPFAETRSFDRAKQYFNVMCALDVWPNLNGPQQKNAISFFCKLVTTGSEAMLRERITLLTGTPLTSMLRSPHAPLIFQELPALGILPLFAHPGFPHWLNCCAEAARGGPVQDACAEYRNWLVQTAERDHYYDALLNLSRCSDGGAFCCITDELIEGPLIIASWARMNFIADTRLRYNPWSIQVVECEKLEVGLAHGSLSPETHFVHGDLPPSPSDLLGTSFDANGNVRFEDLVSRAFPVYRCHLPEVPRYCTRERIARLGERYGKVLRAVTIPADRLKHLTADEFPGLYDVTLMGSTASPELRHAQILEEIGRLTCRRNYSSQGPLRQALSLLQVAARHNLANLRHLGVFPGADTNEAEELVSQLPYLAPNVTSLTLGTLIPMQVATGLLQLPHLRRVELGDLSVADVSPGRHRSNVEQLILTTPLGARLIDGIEMPCLMALDAALTPRDTERTLERLMDLPPHQVLQFGVEFARPPEVTSNNEDTLQSVVRDILSAPWLKGVQVLKLWRVGVDTVLETALAEGLPANLHTLDLRKANASKNLIASLALLQLVREMNPQLVKVALPNFGTAGLETLCAAARGSGEFRVAKAGGTWPVLYF